MMTMMTMIYDTENDDDDGYDDDDDDGNYGFFKSRPDSADGNFYDDNGDNDNDNGDSEFYFFLLQIQGRLC